MRSSFIFSLILGFIASITVHAAGEIVLVCRDISKEYRLSEINFVRYVDDHTQQNFGAARGTLLLDGGQKRTLEFTELLPSDHACSIFTPVRMICRDTEEELRFVQMSFQKSAAYFGGVRRYPLAVHGWKSSNVPSFPLHQLMREGDLCRIVAE
ncbi:MAG: hypothetical protein EOP09_04540 [Proteobacteria bacterium]|nr:MAG: hypothetical protein EOP09_04540 [Pseudomonadota bacterium]